MRVSTSITRFIEDNWLGGTRINESLLAAGEFESVAVADPGEAPYGRAAMQALESLEFLDQLRDTLVISENVGKALELVRSGGAEAGFVAWPDLGADRVRAWLVPEGMHEPIDQATVVLKNGASAEAAADWMNYIASEPARDIIRKAGYRLPERTPRLSRGF